MTALVRPSDLSCWLSSANLVTGVVQLDPWLAPFKESLRRRYNKAQDWITAINKSEGGLEKFSRVCDPIPRLITIFNLFKGQREVWLQHRQRKQYHLHGMGA